VRNENAVLAELFRHNLWANAEMLKACRAVSTDQLATETPGTYGQLSKTLVHLARSQGGYLRRMTDWQPGPEHRLEYDDPFPGIDRIEEHLRFTGERLLAVAEDFAPDRVLRFEYEGKPSSLPAWVVLLQAAFHATEHRQQVATALTNLGVEPPEPDFWAYWDMIQSRP
jgi:uncharacterized damage-inducible protein DinB